MDNHYSAWNPGLESDIPAEYLDLETIYLEENVLQRRSDIEEISEYTGLKPEELVTFRPERMLLHEVIVRITADIVVLEGEDEEDLGRNFRQIANRILTGYIQPHVAEIRQAYTELQHRVLSRVQQELRSTLLQPCEIRSRGNDSFLSNLFGRSPKSPMAQETIEEKEYRIVSGYKEKGLAALDPLDQEVYRSLYRVLGSISSSRGVIGSDENFLVKLVTDHVCANYGSRLIGDRMMPYVEEAVRQEGYRFIVDSDAPILISLKGASAAGKSSLRPMLQRMIRDKGIEPQGYATISPDIWRRLLLDYESLGEAYKYAGRFTSKEVIIIDRKLDQYIRDKADRQRSIPHLLVDRFRFDSFSGENISLLLRATYARYVETMYMYFIVTPPEATVERGWERGQSKGRYKAVEDFLGHSVEAYVGMPKILFRWLSYSKPRYIYEFLDNSVPKGTYPKTIAFGSQGVMNILNPLAFIDIERYQRINIKAKCEAQVYPQGEVMDMSNNLGFIRDCIQRISEVNFIDEKSNSTYMRSRNGVFELLDPECFDAILGTGELQQLYTQLAPELIKARN